MCNQHPVAQSMFFTHTLKRFLYVIFSVFLRFITQSLIHQCKLIILQTEQAECFENNSPQTSESYAEVLVSF